MQIIATTGCWCDVPRAWQASSPDALAALYVREATEGIEGTGIKAGIIKCAHETGITWEAGVGFTPAGQVTLRACARAQLATGLPVTTHTEVAERVGLAQIDVFEVLLPPHIMFGPPQLRKRGLLSPVTTEPQRCFSPACAG